MGRPRNKLLAAIQEGDGRRRLSSTEAGQYVRIIIQRLPKHLKELQSEMLENKEVQEGMTEDDLRKIAGNLNKILGLVYDQVKLVNPEIAAPMMLPIPEGKPGVLLIIKQQILTLPNHLSKMGKYFSADELKKCEGLDWKELENPKNLDRIDDIIKENNTTLSFHKHMLPVSAIRASLGGSTRPDLSKL